jgi:hypothetical protein
MVENAEATGEVGGTGAQQDLELIYDCWATYWELLDDQDLDTPDATIYQQLIGRYGRPAVEYGIGTGRVAVTTNPDYGVDSSHQMLAAAGRRSAVTDGTLLLYGDMCDITLPVRSAVSYVALSAFNSFIDCRVMRNAFLNIRRNSTDEGLFAFDLLTPTYFEELEALQGRETVTGIGDDWIAKALYLPGPTSDTYEFHGILERTDGDGVVLSRRYLPPVIERSHSDDSIRDMLRSAGWTPLEPVEYADVDRFAPCPQRRLWVSAAC